MEIDWRDPSTLHDLSAFQAMEVLAKIGAELRQPTRGSSTHDQLTTTLLEERRLEAMDATAEATAFADACNALGRKIRSAGDCGPALRQKADERRESKLDPFEEYAQNCRAYHRR